jgi:hypothetical protein
MIFNENTQDVIITKLIIINVIGAFGS